MNEFDIVICTALKDCHVINKSINYINNNLAPRKIYIITDIRNFPRLPRLDKISLIDENELLEGLSMKSVIEIIDTHLVYKGYGWYFQQLLKMGFALSKYADKHYLIWDADTIPLTKMNFVEDNKYILTTKNEFHKPYFETMERLIGHYKVFEKSFISEHMIIDVGIMKELIQTIENNDRVKGRTWFEKCIFAIKHDEKNGFSEFETYGTYVLVQYPSLFKTRTIYTYRGGSKIFSIYFTEENLKELALDFETVSFEVNQFPLGGIKKVRQQIHYYRCKIITKIRAKLNFPL